MARTYCYTNALTRLLWSSIFYPEVLIWLTPSLFGKISRFENAFIKEYKMATFLRYRIQSIIKSYSFILKFLYSLFFSSGDIADLNLSLFHPSKLHNFEHNSFLYPTIWELAMKQNTSTIDV